MSAPAGPRVRVPRGHVLYRPHDACAGFVVVHAGTVKVTLTAENGREILLYRVHPGEICLQTFNCLVNRAPYSAEGVAETELEIEIIAEPAFNQRIAADPGFRRQLFAGVAARFADLERLVEDVALSPVPARLARALLRLAGGGGGRVVDITHEALAQEIGSAREVVSRQLAAFARAGLVTIARGHIAIDQAAGLEAIAHP